MKSISGVLFNVSNLVLCCCVSFVGIFVLSICICIIPVSKEISGPFSQDTPVFQKCIASTLSPYIFGCNEFFCLNCQILQLINLTHLLHFQLNIVADKSVISTYKKEAFSSPESTEIVSKCSKVVPNLSRSSPKDFHNCPKIVSQLSQSCPKVVPQLSQSSPKYIPKLSQSCLQFVPSGAKCCPCSSKVVPSGQLGYQGVTGCVQ